MTKKPTDFCNIESCGEVAGRRLAEQRMLERERRYHDILQNLSDAIYLVEITGDGQFRYLETNRAFEAMMGAAEDGMLGKTVGEALRSSGAETSAENAIAKFRRCLELGSAISGEIPLDTPTGRRILHSTLTPLFDDTGRIDRILGVSRDVTASKQAERLNDFLKFALDQAHDAVFLIDPEADHRFRYANDQACSSLGYSRDELLTMSVPDIDPYVDLEAARKIDDQIRKQAFVRLETFHRRKDSQNFPVEVSGTEVEFDGQVLVLSIARDISERKRSEQAIAAREQEYRNLAENSPDSIIRYDRDGRIRYLNAGLLGYLGISASEIIGKRPSEAWPDGRYAELERAASRAVETGELATVEFGEADSAGVLHFNQVRVVPERDVDGRIIGTLAVGRDVTAIREAERKLSHFIDNLPGMAYTYRLSPDGHASFPYISPAIERLYGIKSEDVKDDIAPLHMLWHSDDRPHIEAAAAESARTMMPFHVEARICPPGQPERWHDVRAIPEREADSSILWYGLMLDISERKRAEIALMASEHMLSEAQSIAKLGSWDWDVVGDRVAWSDMAYDIYTPDERPLAPGYEEFKQSVHPDDLERVDAAVRAAFEHDTPFDIEHRVVSLSKGVRTVHAHAKVFRDHDGKPIRMVGTVQDITERKLAQDAMKRSQSALEEAQRIAHVGSWDVDMVNDELTWSDETFRIWEIDKTQFAATFAAFLETVHPEDREKVTLAYNQAISDKSLYQVEHRLLFPDGRVKYIYERGEPYFDEDGRPVRFIGTSLDITERKSAEAALRKSEERMRLFFERQLVGMAITSPEKGWLQANDKICEMFGYSREELARMTWAELTYPDDLPEDVAQFERMLKGEIDSYAMEKRYVHKDGRIVFVDLSVGCVRREDGAVDYVLALLEDITERKRVEFDRKLLTDILEGSPDFVGMGDMQGKLGYHNPAARKMVGLPADADVSKLRIADMHPDWVTKLIMGTALPIVLEQGVWRGETALLHSDGREIPVQQTIMLHKDASGKPVGMSTIMQDITERKHMEEQLRLKEFALDQARDAIYLMDSDGHFFYINEQACRSLGCSRDELLGLTPFDIDPDITPEIFRRIQEEYDAQGFSSCETRHQRRDGSVFPVEIRISQLDYLGQPFGFAFAIDITERKLMEAEARNHLNFFESMDRVNRAIQGSNDLETVLNQVLETVLAIFDCDRAYLIYPCDPDADSWSVPFEKTKPEYPGVLILGSVMPMSKEDATTFRLLLDADGPVTYGSENQHPLPKQVSEQFGIKSLMSMAEYPKGSKPWNIGIHQCSRARAWTADEQKLFQEIGRRLADALTGLLAYRDTQEREQKFQALADSMPDIVAAYDHELRTTYANRNLEQYLAIDIDGTWLRKTPKEHYPDGELDEYQARIEELRDTGSCDDLIWEKSFKGGGTFAYQTRFAALRAPDGKIIGELAVTRDVTQSRQMELELIRNERKFRTLVKNSPGFIARFDTELRRTYVNQAYEDTTKVAEEEVLGKTPLEYWRLASPNAEEFCTILRRVMATRQQERIEAHAITATGAMRYFSMHMVPEIDESGEIDGVLTTGIEITDMKNAERLKVEAREEERKALARELHDDLGQRLTAMRLDIALLELKFGKENPELLAKIKDMDAAVGETVKIVRSLLNMLRPAVLDLGLIPALAWLADEFRKRTHIECRIQLPEQNPALNEAQSIALFRIVQESLTNIIKYAQAKKVEIALTQVGNGYLLKVHDDGKGFDLGESKKKGSFGLKGIEERVRMLGGKLSIETEPGRGMKLTAQLPQ